MKTMKIIHLTITKTEEKTPSPGKTSFQRRCVNSLGILSDLGNPVARHWLSQPLGCISESRGVASCLEEQHIYVQTEAAGGERTDRDAGSMQSKDVCLPGLPAGIHMHRYIFKFLHAEVPQPSRSSSAARFCVRNNDSRKQW